MISLDRKMLGTLHTIQDEESFKAAIIKERQRTERSGQAMVLLLVGVQAGPQVLPQAPYAAITDALSSVKSDIDILGWYERQSIIGLIVPEVQTENTASLCDRLEADFQKAFTRRLGRDQAPRLAISLHVYPEPWKLEEAEHQQMDPSFFPELQDRWGFMVFHTIKRGMDILLSLLLLIVLSPLLGAIAGLVRLSSRGPVIFRQVRVGQKMKPFTMCKFRTMYANSDHGVHHKYVSWFITSSHEVEHKEKNKFFKLKNDTRITPVGHLLRRTSLDELPQLWNVLIGEMSLVGPRPPLWYELERYKPWHRHRVLAAKPGITGLWQVIGRSRTTFDEMVRLDLRYANTMSLWGDIKIILATPAAMLTGKGAC